MSPCSSDYILIESGHIGPGDLWRIVSEDFKVPELDPATSIFPADCLHRMVFHVFHVPPDTQIFQQIAKFNDSNGLLSHDVLNPARVPL